MGRGSFLRNLCSTSFVAQQTKKYSKVYDVGVHNVKTNSDSLVSTEINVLVVFKLRENLQSKNNEQ